MLLLPMPRSSVRAMRAGRSMRAGERRSATRAGVRRAVIRRY